MYGMIYFFVTGRKGTAVIRQQSTNMQYTLICDWNVGFFFFTHSKVNILYVSPRKSFGKSDQSFMWKKNIVMLEEEGTLSV